MKRFIALLLIVLSVLSLVACSTPDTKDEDPGDTTNNSGDTNNNDGGNTNNDDGNTDDDNGSENNNDNKPTTVDITFPAVYFASMTEQEVRDHATEKGYSKCEFNEDGSVVFTMTPAQQDELVSASEESMQAVLKNLCEGSSKVDSFLYIEHDEIYSEIKIYVDASLHNQLFNLYARALKMTGAYHQYFLAMNEEDINCTVSIIDDATKEVLFSESYK